MVGTCSVCVKDLFLENICFGYVLARVGRYLPNLPTLHHHLKKSAFGYKVGTLLNTHIDCLSAVSRGR